MLTRDEVKKVLRIDAADTTYNDDIDYFIPLVQYDIIDTLNNAFQDKYVFIHGSNRFKFGRGDSTTADYIEDTEKKFLDKGFAAGMDIVVEGGGANVGLYTINTAGDSKISMTGYAEFINQEQGDTKDDNPIGNIKISRVKWPQALQVAGAKMVWHLIDDAKPNNAQSESIDDYSITYAGNHAYPTSVIMSLSKYRRPGFK